MRFQILLLILFVFQKPVFAETTPNTDFEIQTCQDLPIDDRFEYVRCEQGQFQRQNEEINGEIEDIAKLHSGLLENYTLNLVKNETISFLTESEQTLISIRECQQTKDRHSDYVCESPHIENVIQSMQTVLPEMRLHMALAGEGKDSFPRGGDTVRDPLRNFVSTKLKHSDTGNEIPSLSDREKEMAKNFFELK